MHLFLMLACLNSEPQNASRWLDPQTATLVDQPADTIPVQIDTLHIEHTAERLQASYLVATHTGRQFETTVTWNIRRDGAEEVLVARDIATGEVVSWSIGADGETQEAADGTSAEVTMDSVAAELVVTNSDGEVMAFSYQDLEEGSTLAEEQNAAVALALFGSAPLAEDELLALTGAAVAAEEDLGGADRLLPAIAVAGRILARAYVTLCNPVSIRVCNTVYTGLSEMDCTSGSCIWTRRAFAACNVTQTWVCVTGRR